MQKLQIVQLLLAAFTSAVSMNASAHGSQSCQDVVVIGAGPSGLGFAMHLIQKQVEQGMRCSKNIKVYDNRITKDGVSFRFKNEEEGNTRRWQMVRIATGSSGDMEDYMIPSELEETIETDEHETGQWTQVTKLVNGDYSVPISMLEDHMMKLAQTKFNTQYIEFHAKKVVDPDVDCQPSECVATNDSTFNNIHHFIDASGVRSSFRQKYFHIENEDPLKHVAEKFNTNFLLFDIAKGVEPFRADEKNFPGWKNLIFRWIEKWIPYFTAQKQYNFSTLLLPGPDGKGVLYIQPRNTNLEGKCSFKNPCDSSELVPAHLNQINEKVQSELGVDLELGSFIFVKSSIPTLLTQYARDVGGKQLYLIGDSAITNNPIFGKGLLSAWRAADGLAELFVNQPEVSVPQLHSEKMKTLYNKLRKEEERMSRAFFHKRHFPQSPMFSSICLSDYDCTSF